MVQCSLVAGGCARWPVDVPSGSMQPRGRWMCQAGNAQFCPRTRVQSKHVRARTRTHIHANSRNARSLTSTHTSKQFSRICERTTSPFLQLWQRRCALDENTILLPAALHATHSTQNKNYQRHTPYLAHETPHSRCPSHIDEQTSTAPTHPKAASASSPRHGDGDDAHRPSRTRAV